MNFAHLLQRQRAVVASVTFSLVVGALYISFAGSVSLPASILAPVLPLPSASGELSFAYSVARDPDLLGRKPEDETDATRLAYELKEQRGDLARAKGARALELHSQAYRGFAALAYYQEEVASGRLPGDRAVARKNLASIRGFLISHAQFVTQNAASDAAKDHARFHILAVQFAQGQQAAAASGLESLSKSKLAPALKQRAAIMAALQRSMQASEKDRRSAQAVLARGSKSLPADAQVYVNLTLARSRAGLNANGQRVRKAEPSYKAQLNLASQKVSALAPGERDETLAAMIAVWRRAEGEGSDWRKVPFRLSVFENSPVILALTERAAIDDWRAGRKPAAFQKYEALANSLSGRGERLAIDQRILELRRVDYVNNRNPRAYEGALVSMAKVYLDPSILGDGQEARAKAAREDIIQRYGALVDGEMTRVNNPKVARAERTRAIELGERYLETVDQSPVIEMVRARIAGLYVLNNQHREAVAIYKQLHELRSKDSARYLAAAIYSQSVLASWPAEAPWRGVAGGDNGERGELLSLYQKQQAIRGDWSVLAHMGLLQISLGQADAAFAGWQPALRKEPRGPHAAQATGYMLVAYTKASQWGSLESLARLALAQNIAPQHMGRNLNAHEFLGMALLEGGKQALAENRFPDAVKKLREFVDKHPRGKGHDEGMFLLGSAYRGNRQHKESVQALLAFVERYPASSYLRQGLLNGGDWSAPMAYEENAMFFYERFLRSFAQDSEVVRVKEALLGLYLGRQLYAEATQILRKRATTAADPAQRSEAVLQVMDLEERHGSMDRAASTGQTLIGMQNATPAQKARALALHARMAAQKADYARVRQIAAQLQSLGDEFAVTDALGEARYLFAMGHAKQAIKEHYNLELTDPSGTLVARYNDFRTARSHYDTVCSGGASSWCAPAMHKLARLSLSFAQSIEDIDVQPTLAKEVVSKFNQTKARILDDATKTAQRADAKAVATVQRGFTSPDATQEVLWQNTSDWTFDRVSGEAGNAYVQWATSAQSVEAE